MPKPPSPCIDVCKFKRDGHCLGCAMTKPQKQLFKSLTQDAESLDFLRMLVAQQDRLGKYKHWRKAFFKKLKKRKIAPYDFLTG